MPYHILENKKGILFLVVSTTIVAAFFAVLITYAIIEIIGKGNFYLGAFIASTCSILITPPISYYCFYILRQLHQSKNELQSANKELEKALDEVKILSGLLPICSKCKKIRDNEGYWNQIDEYLEEHSDVLFSHGLCEHCLEDIYGDKKWFRKKKDK